MACCRGRRAPYARRARRSVPLVQLTGRDSACLALPRRMVPGRGGRVGRPELAPLVGPLVGWALLVGASEHEQPEPLRPVPAQLEEIVEVHESHRLELLNEPRDRLFAHERSDRDQLTLDLKLLWREVEPRIERGALEARAFERLTTNEQRRAAGRD